MGIPTAKGLGGGSLGPPEVLGDRFPVFPPWDGSGANAHNMRAEECRKMRDGNLIHYPDRARWIGKSATTLTGEFISVKDHRVKQFESPLERDLLTIVDFDPMVVAIHDQPVKVPWTDEGGKAHKYTPDVLIRFDPRFLPPTESEVILVEVKRAADVQKCDERDRAKHAAAARYCEERDWRFRVLTETQIRVPYLRNARFLRQYRGFEPSKDDWLAVHGAVSGRVATTPDAVLDELLKSGKPDGDPERRARLISTMWRMAVSGHFVIDLHAPLTMRSPIRSWDDRGEIPREWRSPLWES